MSASYTRAIDWLAQNDDCHWLADDQPQLSVSAALVADLFMHSQDKIIRDLRKALVKFYPNHMVIKGRA